MMDAPPAIVQPAYAIDFNRMLACIMAVENKSWSKPGGALSFTRAAWYEDTMLLYDYAKLREHAYPVAIKRIERFIRDSRALGLDPQPVDIAAMWRRGFAYAISGMKTRRRYDPLSYQVRVSNLYGDPSFQ